jgi:hypothetical protein
MEENLNKVSWSMEVSWLESVLTGPQNLVDQDEYPAAQQIHERCVVSYVPSDGHWSAPAFSSSVWLTSDPPVHDLPPLART